jgi:hypothetical protein
VAKKLVVTVRWMDGKTDIYDDVEPTYTANGVLTVRERRRWWWDPDRWGAGKPRTWHLSLANIRSYSADWVKRQ